MCNKNSCVIHLQKLEGAPHLTAELLKQKQEIAEQNRTKVQYYNNLNSVYFHPCNFLKYYNIQLIIKNNVKQELQKKTETSSKHRRDLFQARENEKFQTARMQVLY